MTAARMNVRAAYCGVLGKDALSQFCRTELAAEGVDCSPLQNRPEARPFHSFVIIDVSTGHRTILYSSEGVTEPSSGSIDRGTIENCRVLFVDYTAPAAALNAARLAREMNIPVVGDVERWDRTGGATFLDYVDHLIVGLGFGREFTGREDPGDIVLKLASSGRRLVAVTAGERGCWWVAEGGQVRHQPAFPVHAVDTIGCGDVFHGAYAVALAEGEPPARAIRFASAAAAVKAAHHAGRAGIPERKEVVQLLQQSEHQV
jgi:sugar/nucleoside kinase (ribokinase family)